MEPLTCLMPIYGRWRLVREAIACFLRQDYPARRLLILNDAAGHPLSIRDPAIEVVNVEARMNLGAKRQWLLEHARSRLVAHFDSDDLYLPRHLSRVAARLEASGLGCAKCDSAWYLSGPYGAQSAHGIHRNVFEGQMVFDRDEALRLGGYSMKESGQALDLLNAFRKARRLLSWEDPQAPTYVYRSFAGYEHVSKRKVAIESDEHPPAETLEAADFLRVEIADLARFPGA